MDRRLAHDPTYPTDVSAADGDQLTSQSRLVEPSWLVDDPSLEHRRVELLTEFRERLCVGLVITRIERLQD